MGREYPKPFNMRDLFIDVKLEAVVNGNTFDFLGRKIFTAEFFRQGIGFGIINIDIEVNTSLQPLVVVTFKDLYGLTVFGGQERRPPGSGNEAFLSHDFSVIFDWPPPKFLFSFKGYLGKPVSWVLNLKKTSTSFNSSDGSYELKCEFVPNQWGIFADLPMLFLLASKALRRDRYGSNPTSEQQKLITSVFDFIKIGKQVEVKTKETTKEFDDLIKQLGSLKSNISNTLVDSRILKFGTKITGVVNNIPITNFVPIEIPALDDLSPVDTEEKMNLKISNTSSTSKLNTFLLLKLTFNGKLAYNSKDTGSVDYSSLNLNNEKIDKAKNQVIEEINKNIRFVEDEIKRRVYSSSKSKLQKITISQIFSQLGKDAAFIIGSILEAGLKGGKFSNRENYPGKIIGDSFPLMIKNGEELPATTANFGVDLGVDTNEMDFVRKFINAISEGIAKDLLKDDASNLSEDNTLKNRVNNAEIAKGNPYKPFYKDIATNILVRGGIAGHITRSYDPNRPGDYGNTSVWDNDSPGEINDLASREIQNIQPKLAELSDTDLFLLRRFCRFIKKFYSQGGEYLLKDDGTGKLVNGAVINSPDQAKEPVEIEEGVNLTFAQLFKELKTEKEVQSIEDIYSTSTEPSDSQPATQLQPLSFVGSNYTAEKIINNGVAYTIPLATDDSYYMIVFEGEDNKKAQEANSSPTDVEYRDEEKDDPDFGEDEPLGYVPINQTKDIEDKDKEAGRVTTLYEKRKFFKAIDYSKLKNPQSSFYDNKKFFFSGTSSGYSNYLWDKDIYDSREEALAANAVPGSYAIAGDIGYTIFSNFNGEGEFVFDMFSDEAPSINQRVFIWRVCKLVLDEIGKLQEEKNQIVGAVLGKAAEQEAGLYKQMHTLFHQWQSLVYTSNQGFVDEKGLIERLESAYGGSHENLKESSEESSKGKLVDVDGNGIPDGAFVYDFPLQRINGEGKGKPVQVKNSIINLEPLYKINGETSVLNIIQQVCTKNNFLFVPIPGNATYLSVDDLYSPQPMTAKIDIKNFFHVLFTPTPESRSKDKNGGTSLSLSKNHKEYSTNSFVIRYGHPDNEIVSNVQIDTDEVKNTAESIVNLQRLVDNENQNKVVTTDCSTLPVLQGRSYKMTVEMLGNAQVYPMQFMFLENSPMFGGLYQVMNVKHSITPNNMKTSVGGIRMRFAGDYGGIYPVTLDTFEKLGDVLAPQTFTKDEKETIKNYNDNSSSNSSNIKASKSLSIVLIDAGYEKGTFEYEFALLIGTKEGYKKGSNNRPSRNNNPGNLAWSSSFKSLDKDSLLEPPNSLGERRFTKFSTPEFGGIALVNKIKNWAKGNYPETIVTGRSSKAIAYRKKYSVPNSLAGIGGENVKLTIEQFMYIYAPPSENNTEGYIKSLVKSLSAKFNGISRFSKIIDYIN